MRGAGFAGLALLAALLLAEATARVVLRVPAVFNAVAGEDDASWRLRWIRRQRERGGGADATQIYYGFDRYDADLGWIARSGLRDLSVFDDRVLNTNSMGLRGRREPTATRRPGSVRIIVLGDSFTFGDEVSDAETWPEQLQNNLGSSAEVLNFGVHGYGHDQMLLLFEKHGAALAPDVVVLGYVSIDMFRNLLSFRDFAKPRFERDGGALRLEGVPVATPAEVLAREYAQPKLLDLATMLARMTAGRRGTLLPEAAAITTALLERLALRIRAIGATPVFVYLPVGGETMIPSAVPLGFEQYLLGVCRRLGVACSSARPEFRRRVAEEGATFRTVGHWQAPGHRAAAAAVAGFLREQALVAQAGR